MSALLKKISPASLVGNVKAVVRDIKEDGGTNLLYKIFGIVKGLKTGESQYGPWTQFIGDFAAVNCVSGEESRAPKCHLPEPLQGMMINALDNTERVEFGCEVHVKRRDDIVIGYEYIVKPVVKIQTADPIAHLRRATLGLPEPVADEHGEVQAEFLESPADTTPKKKK